MRIAVAVMVSVMCILSFMYLFSDDIMERFAVKHKRLFYALSIVLLVFWVAVALLAMKAFPQGNGGGC